MKRQILDIDDIKMLVDQFYGKVRQDELLADIFNNVIQDNWSEHLDKMYRFWQTVLLEERTYVGSPFLPHMKLPIEARHFHRWIALFYETLDEHFVGDKAEEAKWRAERMAEMFQIKIDFFRNNPSSALL